MDHGRIIIGRSFGQHYRADELSETSPIHYVWIAALFVPPVVLLCDWVLLGRRLGVFRGALVSAATIVLIVIGTAVRHGRHLDGELAAFDRDGDGIFGGDEVSADQERAMAAVTNDLSRNLAPVTSGVFAVGNSALVFGLAAATISARRWWKSAA